MKFSSSFYRKIVYAITATILLLCISYLARPRAVSNDQREAQGGVIAQMRAKNNLSQASLSEVDPTSEIMKLGSLGLHGIAVNVLWNQANEYQDKKAFDKVRTTLNTLILLQPNFISVWEFQGHNLAYNISREFDDYEDRYFWVKEGLNFFMDGVAFNKRDHRIYDNLGLHTGLKLGKSDEKRQFREIFRHDDEYIANQLSKFEISADSISHPVTGPDNWKWAYQWYDKSYRMIEGDSGLTKHTSDLMYWMKRESQVRNFADAMDDEFPPGEASQEAWREAFEAWLIYGNRPIMTSFGEKITFEGLQDEIERFENLKAELDKLAPGVRERLKKEKIDALPEDFRLAYDTPADQRTHQQQMMMRGVVELTEVSELEVYQEVPDDQKEQAQEIFRDAAYRNYRLAQIRNYRTTVNYEFWRNRNEMESTDPAIEARSNFYLANGLAREAKYQDYEEEVEVDGKTEFVKREGSMTLMRKSFAAWAQALEPFPFLQKDDSALHDEILEDLARYREMLRITGNEWPQDFELQSFIDERNRLYGDINLPTSDQLKAKSLDLGELAPLEDKKDPTTDDAQSDKSVEDKSVEDKDSPEASSDEKEAGDSKDSAPKSNSSEATETDGQVAQV